ncbi:CocE/NonD family hydrolase C-terminal non-catalytic domain-containing protein, partial [Frankia sp. EI5c]|uniref:CocE/NonD family hydrolase C-terminal non-catalytic domain-containing protein n=1 Tax=Frankia sp. EI5c TaxID=683316 RepID=UPI0026F4553D
DDQYFRSGMLDNVEGALQRTWAVYGPWPHLSPIAFPDCPGLCNPEGLSPGLLLAWFDHWVKQLPDVPVPAKPTFVSFEGPEGTGAGWQQVANYSAATGSRARAYPLGQGGTLDDTAGAAGSVSFNQPADPASADGSVTFQTSPLAEPLSILGHSALSLRATVTGTDANLYAELLDIAPDGTSKVVNDGFLRASHRASHTDPTPLTAGERVTLDVAIRAAHHQFAAGHRVAVRLSGGAADALTPNPTPVEVTVATGAEGSVLTLPVINGRESAPATTGS